MSTDQAAWIIKHDLSADALQQYVAELGIRREQVVALTEPKPGTFTLIYEPLADLRTEAGADQAQEANEARLASELTDDPPVYTPKW